jgi:phage shock protein PspC (stress-responsive transcriptional regulator)
MSENENAGGWRTWGSGPQSEPGQGPDPGAGAGAGAGPGPWPQQNRTRPPLSRDRRSRMIAGVCGGLGRHLDIDPVVFRILFVVLTFFGGFGLLAYAAAWLFVPADGERDSEARKLLTGRSALAAVAVAVLLVLGFMAMVSTINNGFGHAVPLLLLATVIITVLVWRGEERRQPPPGQAQYTAGGWGPNGPQGPYQRQPWWQRPVPTSPAPGAAPPGAAAAAPDAPAPPVPGSPDEAASRPPAAGESEPGPGPGPAFGAQSGAPGWEYQGYAPGQATATLPSRAEPESRPRRISGLTLSGALLILGVLGVLATAGAIHVGWTAGMALAVMAVGAGMVVGGVFGRARALIPVGLVLAVPLILAGALGVPLRGETGDTTWAPSSAAAVASPYDLVAGRGSLDLSAVDPAGGTVYVTAHVGAGQLIVTVPDDVAIDVTAHIGVGRIDFADGSEHSGLDLTKSFDAPAQGNSRGTIVLDLKTGAGDVEVDRVSG